MEARQQMAWQPLGGLVPEIEAEERLAALEYPAKERLEHRRPPRCHLRQRAPDVLGGRPAVARGLGIADAHIPEVAIEDAQIHRRARQHRFEQRSRLRLPPKCLLPSRIEPGVVDRAAGPPPQLDGGFLIILAEVLSWARRHDGEQSEHFAAALQRHHHAGVEIESPHRLRTRGVEAGPSHELGGCIVGQHRPARPQFRQHAADRRLIGPHLAPLVGVGLAGRIGVHDRHAAEPVVRHHQIHDAAVGQSAEPDAGDSFEGCVEIERPLEQVPGIGQEPEVPFGMAAGLERTLERRPLSPLGRQACRDPAPGECHADGQQHTKADELKEWQAGGVRGMAGGADEPPREDADDEGTRERGAGAAAKGRVGDAEQQQERARRPDGLRQEGEQDGTRQGAGRPQPEGRWPSGGETAPRGHRRLGRVMFSWLLTK
jgi:hypothetical protein